MSLSPQPPRLPGNVKRVNLLEIAVQLSKKPSLPDHSTANPDDPPPAPFEVYDDGFVPILGPSPRLDLLLENEQPLFHEAGVYVSHTQEPSDSVEQNVVATLFVTSNHISLSEGASDSTTANKFIQISKVDLPADGSVPAGAVAISPSGDGIRLANGGVNYGIDQILFCEQGTLKSPGGLAAMDVAPPHHTTKLVDNFHGRAFNSPNDVIVVVGPDTQKRSVWFTDPVYGFMQGVRPAPALPSQVYAFTPATGEIRVLADGFGRPNGISIAPGGKVVYITDTDQIRGDGSVDLSRAATIYAFDVSWHSDDVPFLSNRRVFAYADNGVPDGIKCDTAGNVYCGCGDGVHVWNAAGTLLGKIKVNGEGVANFCFGAAGEMFLLSERRLYRAQLAAGTIGALLGPQ